MKRMRKARKTKAKKNSIVQLICYMKITPIFVDETGNWMESEKCILSEGRKEYARKKPQWYSLTAISAISEIGPIYMLLVQNSSINAQKFNDNMVDLPDHEKNRKIIYLDNTSSISIRNYRR